MCCGCEVDLLGVALLRVFMWCWFDVGIVVLPVVCVLLRSWCNIGFTSFVCLTLLVLA